MAMQGTSETVGVLLQGKGNTLKSSSILIANPVPDSKCFFVIMALRTCEKKTINTFTRGHDCLTLLTLAKTTFQEDADRFRETEFASGLLKNG